MRARNRKKTLMLAALIAILWPAFVCRAQDAAQQGLRRLEELKGAWSAEWETGGVSHGAVAAGSAKPMARQLAQSADPELRRRAIEALGKGNDTPALGELLWALGDEDAGVREAALDKLRILSPAALLQQVLDVLVANDEASVRALDVALPELPKPMGDEFLRMFRDKTIPVQLRRAAAYSLGKMRVTAAEKDLANGAWESEATLAGSCALALYALRDTQSVRDWSALRKHPDPAIRWMSIEALMELGGREAFAALAEVAYGAPEFDAQLIQGAIRALAAWPRGDCVPALIEVMKRNPRYRHIAAEQLQFRTGEALGDDTAAWEDWYVNGPALPPEPEAPPTQYSAQDLLGHAQFVPPELSVAF